MRADGRHNGVTPNAGQGAGQCHHSLLRNSLGNALAIQPKPTIVLRDVSFLDRDDDVRLDPQQRNRRQQRDSDAGVAAERHRGELHEIASRCVVVHAKSFFPRIDELLVRLLRAQVRGAERPRSAYYLHQALAEGAAHLRYLVAAGCSGRIGLNRRVLERTVLGDAGDMCLQLREATLCAIKRVR